MNAYQKMVREKLKADEKVKIFIAQRRNGKSLLDYAFVNPVIKSGTVLTYSTEEKPNEIFLNEWSKMK